MILELFKIFTHFFDQFVQVWDVCLGNFKAWLTSQGINVKVELSLVEFSVSIAIHQLDHQLRRGTENTVAILKIILNQKFNLTLIRLRGNSAFLTLSR